MQPITAPIKPDSRGKEVVHLQSALLLLLQKRVIKVLGPASRSLEQEISRLIEKLQSELREELFGKVTTQIVQFFQIQQNLGDRLKGVVEEKTAQRINEILKELGALDEPIHEKQYTVNGTVLNTYGVALANYQAEAFVITLQKEISVGKTVTGKSGTYTLSFKNPLTGAPDIQVRAHQKGDEKNVTRSVVRYNASAIEKLDVIVNAEKEKQDSEFNTILKDVKAHLGKMKLSELKEDKETSHITYISNKTGWDGRVTAMLASAHKLGEALKIDPAHVYAFLRAGVPGSEDAVKSLSMDDAKATIGNAIGKTSYLITEIPPKRSKHLKRFQLATF